MVLSKVFDRTTGSSCMGIVVDCLLMCEIEPKNHLLQGSLFRAVLMLAGPLLASALLQNVQSLIDLYWVGRLGSSAVAALAVSGTTLMMLFPLIMGAATGTVALVSRRIGEGDRRAAEDTAGQALAVALVSGVISGVLGWLATGTICRLLGAPADVVPLASQYLRISFVGCFTMFTLFIGNSVLQAAGNTVVPMLIMVMSNILNLVLDPILIFGLFGLPALGVSGAALATVLAQLIAAVASIYLLQSGRLHISVPLSRWRPRPALALHLMRVGLPGSGQMLARSLMALVLMRIVASCGTAALAAYGIGLRFHMIILMPAFALGGAAGTLVGQNLGARQPERAALAAWLAAAIDVVIMSVAALLLILFAPELVRFFDASADVVETGTAFLRTTSGFFVFVALAIVLGRGLQGAGDTMAPMIITVVALWGVQVPLALFLSSRLTPPTQGIWWAMAVAVVLHGVLVTCYFALGRWKKRRV